MSNPAPPGKDVAVPPRVLAIGAHSDDVEFGCGATLAKWAAAGVLGISSVVALDFVDGDLGSGLTERAAVCEVIRALRPALVLGHDPWKRYRLHPDHRHAGWITLDAVVAARDPHFFPEQGLTPYRPDSMLLFEAEVQDHAETVDDFLDTKVEALLCHRSQWRSTMGIDDASPDAEAQRAAFVARVIDEARTVGRALGVGGAAEAFKLIDGI